MELPMADRIGLGSVRRMGWWAWLPLALYVLLRGLDATALKWLQLQGATQGLNGVNPISFCNVFFVAQLIVGLATLAPGRNRLARDLGSLAGQDRLLLALHGGLGLFLGPVATFLALDALSVISHGEFRRLLRQIEREHPVVADTPPAQIQPPPYNFAGHDSLNLRRSSADISKPGSNHPAGRFARNQARTSSRNSWASAG